MGQAEVNRRGFVRGIAGAAAAGLAAGELRPRGHLLAGSTPSSGGEAWFVRNDPSWINRLSQPQYDIKFEFNVKKVRMRDGINLSANIWRPAAAGKFPVIYMHTSYDKSAAGMIIERAKYYVPRGYVFVAIDARGRHDSDGVAYFYWHENWREGKFEGQDVHDCLTWLGEQPWSTGKIGMTGPSGLAYYQWMGASLGNPYLTTIVPYVSPDDHWDNTFPNAAFHLTVNMHTVAVLGGSRTNSSGLETAFWDWEKLVWHLPLRTMDEAMLGKSVQLWQDFMDHPDNDYYWRLGVGDRPRSGEIGPGKYPQVKVPTLSITGWYDEVQQATINGYLGMRRYGPPELREKHHLVVGPWRHAVGHRVVGDLDFGPGADGDCLPEELHFRPYWLKPVEHRWFDYWLQGIDNGLMDESPVHVFRMGENAWRAEDEWPLSRARELKYYLHSSGHANSRFGDGTLSPEPPAAERTDTFVYDPADPMPSYGGIEPWQSFGIPDADGPRDQRVVNGRNDVLVYTSEPGQEDLEVTGRILCRLYAASTARDTDFTAKLADVHPDGYARILREGILRARYRNSFKKQELLRPGQVYEYVIDLWSVSHVFKKGHKVQVEISSSNFAKYDRNPNTGNRFGEDTELQKATQTIYHESRYPSAIILPVVQS